jgi:DNA-binding response OmpR family regulator
MKVLIADDEPNILLSLEFLMRKNGYQVFVARNGSEALDIIKKELPTVVVLDIMMPDIDGYEICTYLKETPEYQHIKVLFLSAKAKESEIEKGLVLGADAYMTKPFSNKILISKIEELGK